LISIAVQNPFTGELSGDVCFHDPDDPPDRTLAVALRRDSYQVLFLAFIDLLVEAFFNCCRTDPDAIRRSY